MFRTETRISNDVDASLDDRWRLIRWPKFRQQFVLFDRHRGIAGQADALQFGENGQGGEDFHVVNGEFVIDLGQTFEGSQRFGKDIFSRFDRGDVVDVQRVNARTVLQRGEISDRTDVFFSTSAETIIVRRRRNTARASRAGQMRKTRRTRSNAFVRFAQNVPGAHEERWTFLRCDTQRAARLEKSRERD